MLELKVGYIPPSQYFVCICIFAFTSEGDLKRKVRTKMANKEMKTDTNVSEI